MSLNDAIVQLVAMALAWQDGEELDPSRPIGTLWLDAAQQCLEDLEAAGWTT